MQTPGHIVTDDNDRIGVVQTTGDANVRQPDAVLRDAFTGEELSRTSRPTLQVQVVNVKWEDGSESSLTELIDSWTVLGSVFELPAKDEGSSGQLPNQLERVASIDVDRLGEVLREVAPLAAAARKADRQVTIEDDGVLSIV